MYYKIEVRDLDDIHNRFKENVMKYLEMVEKNRNCSYKGWLDGNGQIAGQDSDNNNDGESR